MWTYRRTDSSPRGHIHTRAAYVTLPVMKLVIGIVRPERANEVLTALHRADVRGVSISRVQ
ncbi:MAG: Nitrogen regulatory protein, partial [Solirubrobacteraceae bacterium]|nr:Nitrogen regulatory protein [Solirubrobacteraceae bacterium]